MGSPEEHSIWYLSFQDGSVPVRTRIQHILNLNLPAVDLCLGADNSIVIDTPPNTPLDQLERDKNRLGQISGATLIDIKVPMDDNFCLTDTTIHISYVAFSTACELEKQGLPTRHKSKEFRFAAAVDAAKNRMRKPD